MNQNARTRLICAMEEIIANECYTQGLQGNHKYRYPVVYTKDGLGYRCTGGKAQVKDNGVHTMEYKFGAHRLDIGTALDKILDLFENDVEFDGGGMFGGTSSCYYSIGSTNDEDMDDFRVW